ncbi:hypothetical protein A3SI_19646 [Nitritalea halalkaliphila LW7]|uniref:CRISPR type III-associated protein domain-containing protein n=1 Tax=Nitritalea halalkaliphila LW7 TaxID=1189621 RepID=I5BSL9_9BACT|nr:RAMP superfamily CRISPR-associated protein [Nitritalea halalkaliphila]EIM72571.1 hypothetical protein A3SI_19646 [Nitritalea halalkaliphila LW7]
MVQEKIKYTINFLTDWHAGSGLSGGAEADAVVIKDREGFPYVPGKTLKGLFVDAFCDFIALGIDGFTQEKKNELLGYYDPVLKRSFQGKLFFSNAELPQVERDAIDARHKYFLFRTISSTAIDSESGDC